MDMVVAVAISGGDCRLGGEQDHLHHSVVQIPYFPHTDAHGPCDLFVGKLVEGDQKRADALLRSALARVGLDSDTSRHNAAAMLAAADERLYDAKHGGRNRVIAAGMLR